MEKIKSSLSGKKTYIIAAITILAVVAEKFLGIDIPGFDTTGDWMAIVLGALGLGTLRAGITKSGPE